METSGAPDPNSRESILGQVQAALGSDLESLRPVLAQYHHADLAEALQTLDPKTFDTVLHLLDEETRANVFTRIADLDESLAEQFVEGQPALEVAEIVDDMNPDDAADLLEVADAAKAEAILDRLPSGQAQEVRKLLQYDSDTAGGIMTTEFLAAYPEETPTQIIERIKVKSDDVETIQTVMICGEENKLLGILLAKDLLTANPEQPVSTVMDRGVVQVVAHTDQEACANLMMKYDISILPVVDEQNTLMGIITHDDIMDVLEEEAEEDMYRMVGVGDNEPLVHGAVQRAFKRLPWLTTTLIGMGLVGPLILHQWFKATLEQIIILAFFIPAIMGLSGNTATQSATITVRGLATGEINFGDLLWMLKRELKVALIIATVCAAAMMGFAMIMMSLGLEPGNETLSVARITGIPMICHRAKVDPALASGPFITTLIDIGTQVIYLGLATWLLLG